MITDDPIQSLEPPEPPRDFNCKWCNCGYGRPHFVTMRDKAFKRYEVVVCASCLAEHYRDIARRMKSILQDIDEEEMAWDGFVDDCFTVIDNYQDAARELDDERGA